MRRCFYISGFAILFACCSIASAQLRTDVMKELLAAPAPTPRNAETMEFDLTLRKNVPPDDAPIEHQLKYWTTFVLVAERPPSDVVRRRLIDASMDDVQRLTTLLPLFPASDTFAEKIKQALDRADDNPDLSWARKEIKEWLVFKSKYFLDELLALAKQVKDDEHGAIESEDALVALAKMDWPKAEPLIQTLINSGQQRTSTLALTLAYQHSLEEKDSNAELKYRGRLQSIAADRNFPGRARNDAIEALSSRDWTGRDDWYLSLVADDSLVDLSDNSSLFSPLKTIFEREPDKWIPVMTKLVAGKDRATQQGAAMCLARYGTRHPRRDALLPVLGWLSDPDWIPNYSGERSAFIQAMDDADVPESVPGLIWIVENEEDDRLWAARVLARYKDPRAIPVLKKALAEVAEDDRPLVIEGLLGSGGITEVEQLGALEAYATKRATAAGRKEVDGNRDRDDPLPMQLSIGKYLANLKNPPDALARTVLNRAASLRKKNEVLSKSLLEIAQEWQGRLLDLDRVKRIATNTANANTIIVALNRRAGLRETVEAELRLLLTAGGAPQGIGAILLDENDTASSILGGDDEVAQIALLACARLTQTPLAISAIEPLLKSKNSLLVTAAERYLLADDSADARTLLWQLHPNDAFVTGWRENIPMIAGDNFDAMGKVEEKLRAELLKPNGPTEIFALLANSENSSRVLRIYADKAVYTQDENPSRYRERVVPADEVANFKQFVSSNGLWGWAPQFSSCHHECSAQELLMLTRERGRRVFSHQGFDIDWLVVTANFGLLGQGETQVGRYNLKDFSFKPVLTVPQISFDRRSMWVDEKQGKLYLVYDDQLLRLPIKVRF